MPTIGHKQNCHGSVITFRENRGKYYVINAMLEREKQFGRVAQKRTNHAVGQERFPERDEV